MIFEETCQQIREHHGDLLLNIIKLRDSWYEIREQ